MHVQFAVTDDGDHDTVTAVDLHRWFHEDAELDRYAEIRLDAGAAPAGAMGAAEIVDVVLGHGIALGNLVLSYAAWRVARPHKPPVTITVTANGTSVTVSDASEESVRGILELLRDEAASVPGRGGE
ncbi:hypothetical protein ACFVIM_08955 [Streptomyces sp. NPDC057638]|uniref:effector-associated constant component EACC1 n=1 Tax=Streptomyces sp. NPDC057638 TaxID=3346190 RepID=UPI0036A020F5